MLGCGWRRLVAWHEVKDGPHLVQHVVALGKLSAFGKRYPCSCQLSDLSHAPFICDLVSLTLIFSVSTLDLLVYTLLHLALEDAGPARLVVVRDFQDVGSIDPVVGSASHTVVTFAIELIDGDLQDCQHCSFGVKGAMDNSHCYMLRNTPCPPWRVSDRGRRGDL